MDKVRDKVRGAGEGSEKIKNKYIFPNVLAKVMSKLDMRVQLEASMLSMTFILVGMLISVWYIIAYISFPLWYKIVIVINGLAGIVFLSSFIITTFQSYKSYLDASDFQKEMEKMATNDSPQVVVFDEAKGDTVDDLYANIAGMSNDDAHDDVASVMFDESNEMKGGLVKNAKEN